MRPAKPVEILFGVRVIRGWPGRIPLGAGSCQGATVTSHPVGAGLEPARTAVFPWGQACSLPDPQVANLRPRWESRGGHEAPQAAAAHFRGGRLVACPFRRLQTCGHGDFRRLQTCGHGSDRAPSHLRPPRRPRGELREPARRRWLGRRVRRGPGGRCRRGRASSR
jgi:hypothetical protein